MIRFEYEDQDTWVQVRCDAEGLGRVVDSFRDFLRHAGFHPDNVAEIVYEPRAERADMQMDFFPETLIDERTGG